ncbi:TonB-dependent receptor [Novosphingobium sp. Rr 2-17]|uniref:TonB-dependent receptor domain-containing protein n=1 Tax=Novosphingobium sp. Rr 2-17 TaxID=555793 RepID=UPI000269AB90|nr:TonB-dependent receptor [Novosphingobium sp. Rr 2-17]EIZ78425.1 TonB-dependent receptor [Novosphingobium sp. Rr 2-17]
MAQIARETPKENVATSVSGEAATPSAPIKKPAEEAFSTGVAKGRDRLDSATSTSALKASEIEKSGARSLGEALRNIPGIRVEYAGGEGLANISIRGLPLAATGSKYLQLQEDGMPVLEFGDFQPSSPDTFIRFDRNVAQIEAIRGGSASTFASNSPGGVINLLSKTGDVEGGSVQTTLGLNYGEHRIDADYGHKLSDTLRFHIGGFYRQGEGPRNVGYDAYKGGQIKLNVTKTFANGYVRVYGKYLDDTTPNYQGIPFVASGSNASPSFSSLPNLNIKTDSLLSRNNNEYVTFDGANAVKYKDLHDGQQAVVKSVGFDSQFDFGGWTVSEKFRFADISGNTIWNSALAVLPASTFALVYGGPGSSLSYATGPQAGQVIANPAALNGNGLMSAVGLLDMKTNSLKNVANDLRVNRVWAIGGGNLTATVGFYKSSQDFNLDLSTVSVLSDVRGGGNAALVNITGADGVPITQDGYTSFDFFSGRYRRQYDVNYRVDAPYGSINYHIGKLALGGSVRYDMGKVNGTLLGAGLGGGRVGVVPFDVNGDGQISIAEQQVDVLPLDSPGKVDYHYHYLSYSVGANFRIAEPLAAFARISRGARAAAERILFTPAISAVTGKLGDPASGFDVVKQSELGMKFRQSNLTVNITAFSATTTERNSQISTGPDGAPRLENIVRGYRAKGVEVEAGIRRGVFGLAVGGTYTSAKITSDVLHPELVGNKPRHQASFIFEATPQVETKYVTVGANFIGTTSSYAQDVNQLKLPGYTLVNAFFQVRATDRVQVMLNANNLFNTLAIAEVNEGAIPASGIVIGRAYAGRTVSATARYSF